jgi:tRNA pseudouridine55 synthase
MNGLLLIDKPEGITSHDVIARVRRILGIRRVGHTGTLDPFATGVLVLLIGNATRLARFIDKDEKEYEALVRFGFATDTGDRTGRPTSPPAELVSVSRSELDRLLVEFRGPIVQVPPMYSAKKVGGRKLYSIAREGGSVERAPIEVYIRELQIIENGRTADDEGRTLSVNLRVVCSAGTYVRTLAEDIGQRLGVGAHLAELRRTRAGRFSIDSAVGLEELQGARDPARFLIPTESAVEHLRPVILPADRLGPTQAGLSTYVDRIDLVDGEAVRILDTEGKLAAVGFFNAAEGSVRPRIVLI